MSVVPVLNWLTKIGFYISLNKSLLLDVIGVNSYDDNIKEEFRYKDFKEFIQ
jgi:hypothetical protein